MEKELDKYSLKKDDEEIVSGIVKKLIKKFYEHENEVKNKINNELKRTTNNIKKLGKKYAMLKKIKE